MDGAATITPCTTAADTLEPGPTTVGVDRDKIEVVDDLPREKKATPAKRPRPTKKHKPIEQVAPAEVSRRRWKVTNVSPLGASTRISLSGPSLPESGILKLVPPVKDDHNRQFVRDVECRIEAGPQTSCMRTKPKHPPLFKGDILEFGSQP